ncbi:MAG: ATP-binding cassette domain-containing protein [Planctomycetota bacterium]
MNPVIVCRGLGKSYTTYEREPGLLGSLKSLIARRSRRKPALVGLNLEVHKGEIVGLLGANGAGKTTLMKMLSGIMPPDEGQIEVLGESPAARRSEFKKRITMAMGQKNQVWWDLPGRDSLELLRAYYEIPRQAYEERLRELTELLEVGSLLNTQVRRLSLGERMKIEIMACLLHQPELILLDEPTIGLDVGAQERLRGFIRSYHERYRPTILVTSHYMADIVSLCPRVLLLMEGQLKYDGDRERLAQVFGQKKRLQLFMHPGSPRVDRHHPLLAALEPRWKSDHEVELDIPRDELSARTAEILTSLPVRDFSTTEIPFEAVLERVLKDPTILRRLAP